MGNSVLRCECQDDVRTRGASKTDAWGRQISMEEDTVAVSNAAAWSHAEEGPEPEPPVDESALAPADEPLPHAARSPKGLPYLSLRQASPDSAAPYDRQRVLEDQCNKLVNQNGFIVGLDPTGTYVPDVLERYGHHGAKSATADQLEQWLFSLRTRVAKDEAFDGSRIFAAVVCPESLDCTIDGMPLPVYLWQAKRVVPILRMSHGLGPMKKGVQLMEVPDNADDLLDDAVNAEVFAVKTRCKIGGADRKGIRSAVKQQFDFARRVIQKGLAACLQIEVSPDANRKEACERLLADFLLEALGELQAEEKVILDLSIPEKPNMFLPLIGHPCTMRVTGLSGGCGLAEACRTLEMNVGMVASFGRAFLERLRLNQSPVEFTKTLRATCDAMYQASMAVPTKEVQIIKVETSDGFFVALDQTASRNDPMLQRYGVPVETLDKAELSGKLHQMRSRIFTDPKFNGSRVIATTLSEDSMDRRVSGMPAAKYLWQVKHVVPFLRVDRLHAKEANGVRLINDTSKLDKLLNKACSAGMFGTKARSSIRLANAAGIKAVVDQQFEIASKVLAKGLVPILMPEVDISSPDKGACEELLLDALMAGLQKLRSDEKVIFWLTLPTKSNQYFPLIHHPNCIRLVALSGGYNRGESCQMLKQNCGMVAGFGRAFTEEMRHSMSDKDFSKVLDEACEQVFRVSKRLPVKEEQAVKVGGQEGFFVALDQTGNSIKKILESYGWSPDDPRDQINLQAKLHAFRARVFTHPRFNGSRVIGVLLSTDTMDTEIAQLPTPQYLWEKKVVPFLRVDRGLLDEADGVQLMRDIPRLGATLEKATQVGFFGTKHRNVVLQPNATGIKQAVEQQFEVAKMSLKAGLVPILQIEVDINSPDKATCERMLRQSLMAGLRTIDKKDKVILLLSIPTKADAFSPLIGHSQVLRVLASSGGYERGQACDKLLDNRGLVASFGRAFLDGMSRRQTDNEFARAMDESCDAIFQASRQRADTFGAATGHRDAHASPRGPARQLSRVGSHGSKSDQIGRVRSYESDAPARSNSAASASRRVGGKALDADADAGTSSDPLAPDQGSSPHGEGPSPVVIKNV